DESTDGTLYIVNGLIDTWDLSNEANYDTDNLFVQSEYGRLHLKPIGSELSYNSTYGAVEVKQVLIVADLDNNVSNSWLDETAEGVTFEQVFKSGGTGSYILGIQSTNVSGTMFSEIRKVYPADGAIVVDADTTAWFTKGNLLHVAITFTTSEMKLYENGVLTYTLTAEDAGISAFDIDLIKTLPFVVNRQNVYTKTVRVYNKALTAEEVANNFAYENNLHSIV
ncbi:MAG: LamG-like jellyroll fold domain-containing protein, partial [Eubacteriales bacterium]